MSTRLAVHPFRDDLASAVEHGQRLARENSVLRAKLAARGFNWIQWCLVGLIASCGLAVVYIFAATG